MANSVWILPEISDEIKAKGKNISCTLGIPLIVAELMAERGISNACEAEEFLNADLMDIKSPYLLTDMDKAVQRLIEAVEKGEKIRIYGDYDVDGVTSICILMDVLGKLGAKTDYYIPDRVSEGYGVNPDAVFSAAEDGISLMITVDCGITASSEVELARTLGIDVIITDHHVPDKVIPAAIAVINPKRDDVNYPFYDLAGVGVAYKLASALLAAIGNTQCSLNSPEDYLDFVALGTIADVCPLTKENRIFAKRGLERLSRTDNPGLKALIEICGLTDRAITAGLVGFVIAPRLNAAGRIHDASLCTELLLTDSSEKAMSIAKLLDDINCKRQEMEMEIFEEALSMVKTVNGRPVDDILVLANKRWHPGIIGIVASRLVKEFNRPSIMVSLAGDEGRGSGRSIPGFNLYKALSECSESLLHFGGHKNAAGIILSHNKIDEFRQSINEIGRRVLKKDDFLPKIICHRELTLNEINLEIAESIAMMAPFGVQNPTPLFLSTGVKLEEYRGIGMGGRHLKLKLSQSGTVHDGIGFNLGHMVSTFYSHRINAVDLVYSIEINEWDGRIQPQLNIKDLRVTENYT